MPLDRLWKLVVEYRDILTSVPYETCFTLANLAVEDFDKQPISEMRGHLICLGPKIEMVRQRIAVDKLITEVYILFSAVYESNEFRIFYFTSKNIKTSIKYFLSCEMENSPTLGKITGELIMSFLIFLMI
jgi:hypothetical protein